MTWDEMINKRRSKEYQEVNPLGLEFSMDRYGNLIFSAIRRLNPRDRRILHLRFLRGLPIGRVADQLGISWDAADYLIDQAVIKIHFVLAELLNPQKPALNNSMKGEICVQNL